MYSTVMCRLFEFRVLYDTYGHGTYIYVITCVPELYPFNLVLSLWAPKPLPQQKTQSNLLVLSSM